MMVDTSLRIQDFLEFSINNKDFLPIFKSVDKDFKKVFVGLEHKSTIDNFVSINVSPGDVYTLTRLDNALVRYLKR